MLNSRTPQKRAPRARVVITPLVREVFRNCTSATYAIIAKMAIREIRKIETLMRLWLNGHFTIVVLDVTGLRKKDPQPAAVVISLVSRRLR